MKIPPKKSREKFQYKILSWYNKHKRDLPWRKTNNPYKILISEFMLQQTQVDRVIAYYKRWLKELPNFKALANAKTQKLLFLWSGLGYNSRALRLRELAKIVQDIGNKSLLQDGLEKVSKGITTEEEIRSIVG